MLLDSIASTLLTPYQCDDSPGDCSNCLKRTHRISLQLPCLRQTLPEALLSRRGNLSNIKASFLEPTNYWKEGGKLPVSAWHSVDSRVICVTQNHGPSMQFHISEFIPIPVEKLGYNWVVGNEVREMVLPPYAISNFGAAHNEIAKVIRGNVRVYIRSMLKGSDDLVKNMFILTLQNVGNTNQVSQSFLRQIAVA
jgi:hypothetical protein